MRDYMTLGPTPWGEDCVQVSKTEDYIQDMRKELQRYKRMLEKRWPNAKLGIKFFPHEFGSYGEVVVWFDSDNEREASLAYEIEANLPETWEETVGTKERG